MVQSEVRISKVLGQFPEKVPGKVWETLVFNRVLEKVWCRAKLGSTRFWKRFWKALVQSRAKFNEVPERVPFTRFRRKFWRRFRKVLVRPGSTRFRVGSGANRGVCRRSF